MRISDWSSDVCSSDLPDVEPNADRSDDAEDDEISPLRLQFGHILEIHAVDSGNRGRHREDRGPGGKLTRDRTLALLFEQVTRLEHRDQDVAEDRKSTRLNSSPYCASRMPSSACKKK